MDAGLRPAAGVAGPAALAAPDHLVGRRAARELPHLCPGRDRSAAAPVRGGAPDQLGGWAMPSVQVAYLTAGLMTVLYTLVPEGRWRTGKWLVAGLITLVALARMALGRRPDRRAGRGGHRGHPPAVAVPPVRPQRGLPGHLPPGPQRPPGRRRGLRQAIRRALEDSWAWSWKTSSRSGWPGSAGSTRCGSRSRGPAPAAVRQAVRPEPPALGPLVQAGPELLYGRLEDEKPFNTVRRLVQQEDYALHKLHAAGLPSPAPFGFVELTPEREYLLVAEFFDGATEPGRGRGRPGRHRRRPGHHPQASGRGPGPPRHQAGQPAGPRRPPAADRRRLRRGPASPGARPWTWPT